MTRAQTTVNTNDETSNDLEVRYEMYKERLKKLKMMDDIFVRNVLQKIECTEHILQTIMSDKTLKIKDQIIQKDFKNLYGRSGTFDCVANAIHEKKEKEFDIEVEQEKKRASPKRLRYHGALLDAHTLNPGENFDELPESYVIFITKDDTSGSGLPLYRVDRKVEETGENFEDELHIICVNGQNKADTELGRLMQDFHCTNAKDMHSEVLAARVKELKETPKGVLYMCKEMDEIYEMGEREKARKTAIRLAAMGDSAEKIAVAVDVSLSLVLEWLAGSMIPAK